MIEVPNELGGAAIFIITGMIVLLGVLFGMYQSKEKQLKECQEGRIKQLTDVIESLEKALKS